MNTFRVLLELRSGLGTPLAGDTLWGHIAWGIRWAEGQAALADWLAGYDAGRPPLVVSDPLPAGFWPRPLLPPQPRPRARPPLDQADRHKRLGRRSWVAQQLWPSLSASLAPDTLADALAAAAAPPEAVELSYLHAAVNRLTGGTAQADGGTLYATPQLRYAGPFRCDVWALSPEPASVVRRWFEAGLAGGYGRDASAGLGHLGVVDVLEAELPAPPEPNALVLLGPVVPRRADPSRGFFQTDVRAGRVGGDFAIGALPDGSFTRQKLPVRCLRAGSVLLAQPPLPRYVGRVVAGVHPSVPEIRHAGIAPVLPCRLSGQLLSHRLLDQPPLPAA